MSHGKIRVPGRHARMLIHIEMPTLLLYTVGYLLSFLHVRAEDPLLARAVYPDYLPFFILSFGIVVFGVLLIERLETEGERKDEK